MKHKKKHVRKMIQKENKFKKNDPKRKQHYIKKTMQKEKKEKIHHRPNGS